MMTTYEFERRLENINNVVANDKEYKRVTRIGVICLILFIAFVIALIVLISKIFSVIIPLLFLVPIGSWVCYKIICKISEKQKDTEAYKYRERELAHMRQLAAELDAVEEARVKAESEKAQREFEEWYNGLSETERMNYETNKELVDELKYIREHCWAIY